MTRLNRKAYEQVVAEDLQWLLQQPRTLERDHVEQIVRDSVAVYYPANRGVVDAHGDASENPRCSGCGGLHLFDTVVPSPLWNRVIRGSGLADYLCATCIMRAFVKAGEAFTAELWGDAFNGEPIEVRMRAGRPPLARCYVTQCNGENVREDALGVPQCEEHRRKHEARINEGEEGAIMKDRSEAAHVKAAKCLCGHGFSRHTFLPDIQINYGTCMDCEQCAGFSVRSSTAQPKNAALSGVGLIAIERDRQQTAEGWTPEHDDAHVNGEMAVSAARYALHDTPLRDRIAWAWESCWWKSKDPICNLARAGALIAAEIDRRLRSQR